MSEREAFTPFEEAFFRAGVEMENQQVDAVDDLEDSDVRPRSLLRRLFTRKSAQQ
jgi:hypothetical protein